MIFARKAARPGADARSPDWVPVQALLKIHWKRRCSSLAGLTASRDHREARLGLARLRWRGASPRWLKRRLRNRRIRVREYGQPLNRTGTDGQLPLPPG